MTNSRQLRVAIAGAGRMGRLRAEGVSRCDASARVTAVCDVDAERAGALAGELPGCDPLLDPAQLPWASLDAVCICSPPYARGEIELAAIAAGVPFLVEKPVGVTVEAASPVLDALRRRPVLTAVGYMNRYRPSVARARALLDGRTVLGMACNWIGTRYKVPWWARPEQSGGPINEQATHLVDLGRYLVGEVRCVQGLRADACPDSLDSTAGFTLGFANGAVFSLLYSCDGSTKMIKTQVFTVDTNILLDGWDFRLREPAEYEQPCESDRYEVFHTETRAFVEAVARGTPEGILCDFEDAVRTQRVVDAMVRAIHSGAVETVLSAP